MSKHPLFVFCSVCVAVVALWCGYWWWIEPKYGGVNSPGVFGDMFGAFSALMSALGFAAVSATLYLQSRELERQRQSSEVADQRNEEQLRLLRTQLEQAEAQRTREEKRWEESIEPRFRFETWPKVWSRNGEPYQVTNYGGAIVALKLISPTPTLFAIEEPGAVENGLSALMTRTGNSPQKAAFFLEYTRVIDGSRRRQRFVQGNHLPPVRVLDDTDPV